MFNFTLHSYRMKNIISWIFVLTITSHFAQQQVIDHNAYNSWKKLDYPQVNQLNEYVSYEINPHRGDGYLYIYNVLTEKLDSFVRGKDAQFAPFGDFVAFKIVPGFDTLRNCELNKVDKKKWPKDTLAIYLFKSDSLIKIPNIKSFRVEKENNWISYTTEEQEETVKKGLVETKTEKKKKCKRKQKAAEEKTLAAKGKEEKSKVKSDGNTLHLYQPVMNYHFQRKHITDYQISKDGSMLATVAHQKVKTDTFTLSLYTLKDSALYYTFPQSTSVKGINFSKDTKYFAYLTSSDTTKTKAYFLQHFSVDEKKERALLPSSADGSMQEKSISENRKPFYSDDKRFLFFGVIDRPEEEKKDTLLASEKVELDLWHYQDKRIQPQQLVELKKDQKKSDLYAYLLDNGRLIPLSNDTLSVQVKENVLGNFVTAYSNESYVIEAQWESPNKEDVYRISLENGTSELIHQAALFTGSMSPKGRWYTYFDPKDQQYYVKDLDNKSKRCISCLVKKVVWVADMNGMPMSAYPFGVKGYDEDERTVYIQSHYDVWSYDLSAQSLTCITKQQGEKSNIRLELKMWSSDSIYVSEKNSYIEGFNEKTKGWHFYNFPTSAELQPLYISDHKLNYLHRSKDGKMLLMREMSLTDYPDLQLVSRDFKIRKTVSTTNPQQNNYNWAKVELIQWKSYKGVQLEGLLYKPENFDPTKKYPMLVYYYELHNEDLHNHYVPKPTASIIYPTEYASAGYIVFIPDVRYQAGHPAKSAYDCIMSGTDYVLKYCPQVDSTRMGLQGQSWGGYQTAQLITMTNRYAAAMAGAPVANMFSAYGGIRWGSGINRQFQYEHTQSRIGKTIWEAPELYVENSPLFHLPKVKTPLMIMHNDKDGAVPWYQGIELYTGLRRLGKPCWLLNYNDDDHNLTKNANKMDLSIRMRQFFDYYLNGQPAPLWLTEGIPATVKGKEMRYETIKNESPK